MAPKKRPANAQWGGGLGSHCMSTCTGQEWQSYLGEYKNIRGDDNAVAAARRELFTRFLQHKAPAALENINSHYHSLVMFFRRHALKAKAKSALKDNSTADEACADGDMVNNGELELRVIEGTASPMAIEMVEAEQHSAQRKVRSKAVKKGDIVNIDGTANTSSGVRLSETPPQGFKKGPSKGWKRRRCSSGSGSRRSLADTLYDELSRCEVALAEAQNKLKDSKARSQELEDTLNAIARAQEEPDGSAHAALIAEHDTQCQYVRSLEEILEAQQKEIAQVEKLKETLHNVQGEVENEKEGRIADRAQRDAEVTMIANQKQELSEKVSSLEKAADEAEREIQESKDAENTTKRQVQRHMIDTLINVTRIALATEFTAEHRRDTVLLYLQSLVHADESVCQIFYERQDNCGPAIREIFDLAAVHGVTGLDD